MPRKVFVAGEILTAADVNTNLMDQAVMVFDDDAARTTAIPTPSEGMVTYLKDTDAVEKFDGSAFVNVNTDSGKILQVVSTVETTNFATSSSSFVAATDYEVSITPIFATSNLVILMTAAFSQSTIANPVSQLRKDATLIFEETTHTIRGNGDGASFGINFVESAGSTASRTYDLVCKTNSGTVTIQNGVLVVFEVAA